MGDFNQYRWVQNNLNLIKGPVLEVGSRHYTKDVSINYRSLCKDFEYVGVDMSAGDNVDLVVDFTASNEVIMAKLGGRKFNTIICCSVLEHVDNIFAFANNLSNIIEKGGILFVSVPFTWRFHGYPNDYWRYTPEGLKYLLKEFDFNNNLGLTSSNIDNDVVLGVQDPNSFVLRTVKKSKSFLNRILLKFSIKNQFENYNYVLLPSMISMVGKKK